MRAGLWIGLAATGLVLAWQAGPAAAAESFKVGVIQQRAVVEKTKAGKRALASLKEFSASRERIIAVDDAELKKLEEQIKSQEGGLSEAAKQEKQEQFRAKFENYQRRIQDFNAEIQQKQSEITAEFVKKLDVAVQAVAEKGRFAAVIDAGGVATVQVVIYAHPSVELTDEVVKEFDRRNK